MSKRILVAGAGKSGISASKLLLRNDIPVLLFDSNDNLDTRKIITDFDALDDIKIVTGKIDPEDIASIDSAILSPGISLESEIVSTLVNNNVKLIGEIELGFKYEKGTLISITGTNGKTTTTALLGEILKRKYPDTFVVGNIGYPYTDYSDLTTENSVSVLETSSFQLETIESFHPHVSAILNITPDHMDRHHSFSNYAEIKESVTRNQTSSDYCILNYDDPELRRFAGSGRTDARIIFFSGKEILSDGYYLKNGSVFRGYDNEEIEILKLNETNLLGEHNYENIMAAVAMASCLGVSDEEIRDAAAHFKAVEHRIEFVRKINGVSFYNDSKGTNPDAALRAIGAMPGPVLLIGGGYDKKSDYTDWVKSFKGKVKYLSLIGQTAEDIADVCRREGFRDFELADSLDDAIANCFSHAESGDYVLLSPACASWGMFANYEERGRLFKEYVNRL